MDTLYTVPEYPREDTKLRALEVKLCGGGPAATGVVSAAKLGISSGFFGVLSDDTGGRFLLEDFKKYAVDTGGIEIIRGCRSFTASIWLSEKTASRTCVFDKGTLPPLKLSDAQKTALSRVRLLLIDGNELDAAAEAAGIVRESGGAVLYDAGGLYGGVERLLALADILIPSEEFALAHTGAADAKSAAKSLMERYRPRVVVITQGKRGGVFYEGGEYGDYPSYPAGVVDSNGAGDVFHGAFAAGWVKGFSPEQCCHFASAVSALKCTGFGARESVPDYDTAILFLRRNGYEL
jgi:sugar/nucleoside kinase (ribokinase family)